MRSLLDKLFGGKAKGDTAPESGEPPRPVHSGAAHQILLDQTQSAMDRHWASVGQVEDDVIAYMIPPGLQGGPDWPTVRQAYRVVRRPDTVIISTDGMSDPYMDDDGENGFGMEVFIETADIPAELSGAPGDVASLKHSWAFELLEHAAGLVASNGGFRDRLDSVGSISSECSGVSGSHSVGAQVPARFVTGDDSVGLLLGGPEPDFPSLVTDTPMRSVRLVPLVVLTAAELEFVRAGGPEARRELANRLAARPRGHLSDLKRESVV